jgi:dihydropteroate synthase
MAHAERMIEEGADAIDVGGQSTRPGGEPVGPEAEWSRIRPVLEALAGRVTVPISIDTYWGEVARRGLDLGAAMINDVSALGVDPSIAEAAASADAGLVLMHSQGAPSALHARYDYQDLPEEIAAHLEERAREAERRGVARERIALDPGIGFSKRAEQSLEAIRGLPRLTAIGYPLYIGVSRKSFLAGASGRLVEGRLAAGLAITVAAYALGARIFRTHDVRETQDTLRAAEGVLGPPAERTPSEPRA